MSHHVTERYKMNDNPTNERLAQAAQAAQAAQVKRVFQLLDDVYMYNKFDSRIDHALEDAMNELTDLLRSLGVEVVR